MKGRDGTKGRKKPKTLSAFLGDYVGALHSSEKVPGGVRMSENPGKKFAAGLGKKREAGRL